MFLNDIIVSNATIHGPQWWQANLFQKIGIPVFTLLLLGFTGVLESLYIAHFDKYFKKRCQISNLEHHHPYKETNIIFLAKDFWFLSTHQYFLQYNQRNSPLVLYVTLLLYVFRGKLFSRYLTTKIKWPLFRAFCLCPAEDILDMGCISDILSFCMLLYTHLSFPIFRRRSANGMIPITKAFYTWLRLTGTIYPSSSALRWLSLEKWHQILSTVDGSSF